MSTLQHENTLSRRQALQMLYRRELAGVSFDSLDKDIESGEALLIPTCPEGAHEFDLIGTDLSEYAQELLEGIEEKIPQIDEWISEVAYKWSVSRMPIVDRNIIRLAIYEMQFREDIPVSVAINEAVELAKAFGGDDSPRFVNGVLGHVAKNLFNESPVDIDDANEELKEELA